MALTDFIKKKKDQLVNALNKPAPQWAQKIPKVEDTLLPKLANAPQFNFSQKVQNPVGKFAAQVAEGTLNIPSKLVQNYGKTMQDASSGKLYTPKGLMQFAGRTGENALDVVSMGKGKAALQAGDQFLKGAKPLGQLMKEGWNQGKKVGTRYGLGYGLTTGVQDENATVGSVAENTAVSGLAGRYLGGALSGGLPAIGALPGVVKNSIKNRLNKPQVTDSIPAHYVPNGRKPVAVRDGERPLFPKLPENERFSSGMKRTGFDEVVQSPKYSIATQKLIPTQQKTNRAVPSLRDWSREVSSAMPAPGMTIAAVKPDANGNWPVGSYSARFDKKPRIEIGIDLKPERNAGIEELRVVNPEMVKTKSQLTDLWKKAQGDSGKMMSIAPLPGKIDEIVKAEAEAMIDTKRNSGGVTMINTGSDYLPGAGEFNRVSANPSWYRRFYKENGRAPSKKEIIDMARRNLERGTGYLQDEYNRAQNPTVDDINAIIPGVKPQTKAEVFQQPPRIFKNREYPQADPLPGSIVAPSRTLPVGVPPLMLPAGPVPTMRPAQAKNFASRYGQAPEVKTEIKSSRPIFVGESGQASYSRNKAGGADIAETLGDTEFSDIGTVAKGNLDIVRNFRKFFGKRSQEFVDKYIAPFQQSKDVMYKNLEKESDVLDKVIVKGLGIERGSKESAAVQEFGEGLRDEASLVKEFGEGKARNIVMANQWFRAQYDRLLGEVNRARSYVYPNQPDKQIQRRDDYYRHFRELQDGFQGLANIFETPAGIDNKLAGISDQTKPNSKWLSFAQKRLGMKTDVDAVGGYIDYLGAAEYAKNVDPKVSSFRQLSEQIAEQGNKEGKDYNNFVGFLERVADHLSGKTNSLDRGIQEFTGRKAFKVVDWLNRRVKANTILGNASSSLAQIFAVPAGISSAGEKNFYKGTKRLVSSIGKDDAIMRQSPFLRERYFKALDKFDTGILNNTKKFAVWMVTALDEVSTKATWNAHYEKALSEGIQNPIKYADEITGNIVGRRGIGETPLLQQSKTFQMVAPFQLEVANAWPLMKELSDEGKSKLLKLFVYTYILNRGVEAIRGSDVAFDPIQAGIEGINSASEEDTTGGKLMSFGGRMAGEVLSNVPLGQTMAGLYPEYGAKDALGSGVDLPTREKLFGKGDPTRFGSGLLVSKGIQDWKYKVLPPFGGAQIKRTVDGIKSFAQGYKENSSGNVQFPIEQNMRNFIQGGVFGPSSVPEGRSFYKEEKTPLGDVQSEKFKLGGGKEYYDKVMNDRQAEKEKTSLKGNGVVDVAKASGTVPGIKQLSNGKFYSQELDKEFSSEKAAEKAMTIENWKNSDQETLEYGGKYYYKDDSTESGYRSKTLESKKKDEATKDVTLSKEKMQSYKSSKDVDSWLKEADVLYKKYDKMLRAETDEVERLKIENDMKTLAEQFNKYKSYGGYTKPKKSKKVKIPSVNDADFIVKKMTSRLKPLRAFGRSRTNIASVSRPNIRRPKKLA